METPLLVTICMGFSRAPAHTEMSLGSPQQQEVSAGQDGAHRAGGMRSVSTNRDKTWGQQKRSQQGQFQTAEAWAGKDRELLQVPCGSLPVSWRTQLGKEQASVHAGVPLL